MIETISSDEEFRRRIRRGVTLIDFYARWCAPCRVQEDILHHLIAHFENRAIVARMDLDRHRKTAAALNIRNIPTLILFRNGKEVARMVGLQSEETIAAAIEAATEHGIETTSAGCR